MLWGILWLGQSQRFWGTQPVFFFFFSFWCTVPSTIWGEKSDQDGPQGSGGSMEATARMELWSPGYGSLVRLRGSGYVWPRTGSSLLEILVFLCWVTQKAAAMCKAPNSVPDTLQVSTKPPVLDHFSLNPSFGSGWLGQGWDQEDPAFFPGSGTGIIHINTVFVCKTKWTFRNSWIIQ